MEIKKLTNIASIIEKYLQNRLSENEKRELETWLQESEKNTAIFKRICSENFLEQGREKELGFDTNKAYKRFIQEIRPGKTKQLIRKWSYAVAAAIIILAGTTLLLWTDPSDKNHPTAALTHGYAMARLTLNNGKVIEFSGEMQDTLQQEGVQLLTDGKSIAYKAQQNVLSRGYNTLEVPRKGEFFLVLSDGTRVWLNSETKLRYPVSFPGGERTVEIQGEAYFEVQKDTLRPFKVHIPGKATVEVTGTAFNVNNYPEEEVARVTLVEGHVNLTNQTNTIQLTPGEQGYAGLTDELGKKTVNTHLYTAWKDGRFVFKQQTLEEIMRTISRWYDINIIFVDEEVSQVTFSGNLQRYDDFGKIINMLESIQVASFEVKENNIRVSVYKKAD